MTKWLKFGTSRTPIGLDIGAGGFRASQMRRRDDQQEIQLAVRCESQSRPEVDDPGDFQRELRMMVRDGGFSGRSVVTSMDASNVKFHSLDVPPAALEDAAGATDLVQFEVSRLMNESPETLETRFWCVPSTEMPAPNAIGVGVLRSHVEKRIELCDGAGLTCTAIDADALALHRFGLLLADFPDAIWGIVDVGERHVRLVLCVDQTPALVRNVGCGSSDWTRKIAEALQIGPASAEVHKQNHGISAPTQSEIQRPNETATSVAPGELPKGGKEIPILLTGALRPALAELAGEIKRSYEYLLNCYPGRAAGDLILVGGGALMPNLPEYLTHALGIKARRASAYLGSANCTLSDPRNSARPIELHALAIGLAT